MDYSIVYDPTVFVRDSIKAVVHTLLEAVLLVVLVEPSAIARVAPCDLPHPRR